MCLRNSENAIWKRKILIPPLVEPEQAPTSNVNAKIIVGNGPQAVKSPRPKPSSSDDRDDIKKRQSHCIEY